MFRRIDTVIVRVSELQRSSSWYQEVLRLTPVYEDPGERLVVLSTPDGGSITLLELRPGESLAPSTAATPYPIFAVDDAAEVHEALQAHGVGPDPVGEGTGVRFVGFRDPDGNRLEACEILT